MRPTSVLRTSVLVAAASWALVLPPAASAAPPAVTTAPSTVVTGGRPLATARVLPHARLVDGGKTVIARIRIMCQPNGVDGIQWEAFADADQEDATAFTEVILTCDGRPHVYDVVLPASEIIGSGQFTRGAVQVSIYVQDENTLTLHATDIRTVRLC